MTRSNAHHILGCNVEFGDFKEYLGVQSVSVSIDSSSGDLSVTVIVDDHQGTFGIADVVNTTFNEDSFTTGIRFYLDLPDYIDFNSGKIDLMLIYEEGVYGFTVDNVLSAEVHISNENVGIFLTNYMVNTALPTGDLQFTVSDGEIALEFSDNHAQQSAKVTYDEFSGLLVFFEQIRIRV